MATISSSETFAKQCAIFLSVRKTVNIQGYSKLQEPIKTCKNCYPLIWKILISYTPEPLKTKPFKWVWRHWSCNMSHTFCRSFCHSYTSEPKVASWVQWPHHATWAQGEEWTLVTETKKMFCKGLFTHAIAVTATRWILFIKVKFQF